jgi:hypothetical protein
MTTTTKTRPDTVSPEFDFRVFGTLVWIEPERSRAPEPFTIGFKHRAGRQGFANLYNLFHGKECMKEGYHPKDPILLRMYGDTIIVGRWERPMVKETVTYKKRVFLFFKRTESYQRDALGDPKRMESGNLFTAPSMTGRWWESSRCITSRQPSRNTRSTARRRSSVLTDSMLWASTTAKNSSRCGSWTANSRPSAL